MLRRFEHTLSDGEVKHWDVGTCKSGIARDTCSFVRTAALFLASAHCHSAELYSCSGGAQQKWEQTLPHSPACTPAQLRIASPTHSNPLATARSPTKLHLGWRPGFVKITFQWIHTNADRHRLHQSTAKVCRCNLRRLHTGSIHCTRRKYSTRDLAEELGCPPWPVVGVRMPQSIRPCVGAEMASGLWMRPNKRGRAATPTRSSTTTFVVSVVTASVESTPMPRCVLLL